MRKTMSILVVLTLMAAGAAAQESGEPATTITGFADAAYFHTNGTENADYDPDNPPGLNGEFTLDQVEVDIIHQASEKTLVRADLEWIRQGDQHVAQVEQAFMRYTTGGPALDITFGKFNAPIGLEGIDPVDMYQYSHSLVFDHGGPTNLVGVSVAKIHESGFDWLGHMSNGWDAETMTGGNTTFGGRAGYAKDALGVHLSVIGGKEDNTFVVPTARTVIEADATYELEKFLFGGEINLGDVTEDTAAGDVEYSWKGFLLMTHMTLNEWMGLTLRWDMIDDEDGWIFGGADGDPGTDDFQNRSSLTFCPTFALDDNFGCLFEVRIDMSSEDAFTDGDGEVSGSKTSIAFETTYAW